ncbi:MAG: hypothetical protein QOH47_2508 [Sphingomonadales bacterium]|jgi:hypothetical protein|nr:hypothetical protein [Sphingomonadales bacterium]
MTHDQTFVSGCVIDADNVNFFNQLEVRGERRQIDLLAFRRFLIGERRVQPAHAVVCTNYLRPMEAALLSGFGFRCVEAKTNCDDLAKSEIRRLVEDEGVNCLTVCSGDGRAYADLLRELKAKFGIRVHVVSRRFCLSQRLARLADGISYLERFAVRQRRSSTDRPLFPWARQRDARSPVLLREGR